MNVDGAGNFALGYSLGSATMFPSIAYTGRLASDPLGTMPLDERILLQGGGSQTGSHRWGDYVSMSIDPVDDCTFWFTNEYFPQSASTAWQTRVFAFKLPVCVPETPGPNPSPGGSPTPTPTPSVTPTPTPTPTPTASPTPLASPTPQASPPPGLDTTPPSLTGVGDLPDPFRPHRGELSNIFWTLDEDAQLTIDIHDAFDRYILTLASEPLEAGDWYIQWDGTEQVQSAGSEGPVPLHPPRLRRRGEYDGGHRERRA